MGTTLQQKKITIEFDCQFRVCVAQSSFSSIMKAFLMLLPQLLEDFFQKVLVGRNHSLVNVVAMTGNSFGRRGMEKQRLFSPGFDISRSNSCRCNARRAAASSTSPERCSAWNRGREFPKKRGASWR